MKKLDWKALILGFLAKLTVETALNAIFFVVFGAYMRLALGASPWWLHERFLRSPVGMICGTVAALAAYWTLGFVIGHFAKRAPFFNITSYLVVEALLSLLALGLDIPYSARVDFWESLIQVFCVAAAFVGGLSVHQIVKNHENNA